MAKSSKEDYGSKRAFSNYNDDDDDDDDDKRREKRNEEVYFCEWRE
jgi:hypothetical protein